MLSFTLVLAFAASALATPIGPRATCSDVAVFFARGTTEPAGLGIIGRPFQTALKQVMGASTSVTFTATDYPADVGGFLVGGSPEGATNMANDVTSTANACPDTKIVISGYSQGAQVAHLAAKKLSAQVQDRVSAAVVFGDPDNGQAFAGSISGRTKTFCAAGDLICAGSFVILPAHLSYTGDATAAANFVKSQVA